MQRQMFAGIVFLLFFFVCFVLFFVCLFLFCFFAVRHAWNIQNMKPVQIAQFSYFVHSFHAVVCL